MNVLENMNKRRMNPFDKAETRGSIAVIYRRLIFPIENKTNRIGENNLKKKNT